MAEELVELGRRKPLRVVVAPRGEMTGVRCLSLGRMISRTECGLAVAANGLQAGSAQSFQMGLNTVQIGIRSVNQMLPAGSQVARRILSSISSMNQELKKGKISKAKSAQMFKTLQDLKLDVDRLFATGAQACPGGKKK